MTRITRSGECGNSPKNAFAEDFAIALLTADADKLNNWLAAQCSALLPNGINADGTEAIMSAIGKILPDIESLRIHHAITHGRVGAINGELVQTEKTTGFALMLDFKTTKADSVAAIRLYLA
ncbi:hypothetical protein [Pelagibacterium mangrovi]|uniref:hypothetical protein n=1 Tax=Pelagibacterium mangrovi TaxID=3119828 RepID=UPI002FC60A24